MYVRIVGVYYTLGLGVAFCLGPIYVVGFAVPFCFVDALPFVTTPPSSFSLLTRRSSSSSTSTPAMSISLTPSSEATKRHRILAMQKWLIVDPISSQLPSSFTTQKKWRVRKSLSAITNMNKAEGATPRRLLRMPRFADTRANGIMSLRIRRAPWEKGSKMGIRRATLSRLKEDIEATFPVLKNADWRRARKNRETRASVAVSDRNGEDVKEAGRIGVPFSFAVDGIDAMVETYTACSRRTHVISVILNPK